MELMAVIVALETLKERCKVTLHSDSQYIVNAITSGSVFRWRKNGWTFKPGGTIRPKNPDLWERLLAAYEKHEVKMIWVKGHAGLIDNERCDALAMAACRMNDLSNDPGYMDEPASAAGTNKVKYVAVLRKGLAEAIPKGNRKITAEGQSCRHCGTSVVKRVTRRRKLNEGQTYYYAWHLYCPTCKVIYHTEEAKRHVDRGDGGRRDGQQPILLK